MKKCRDCKHIVKVDWLESLGSLGVANKPEYAKCAARLDPKTGKMLDGIPVFDYVIDYKEPSYVSLNRENASLCDVEARWFVAK